MLECAVTAVSDNLLPQRRRHLLLFDVQPRAAAGARRPVRDVGAADRAHRPLARDVGAQGVSVRAAARDRRPGHRSSISTAARARSLAAERAGRSGGVDALRLPGQARDQRARAAEAPASRRQSGRTAARARLQHRAMHRRCSRTSMRAGTSSRGAGRRTAGRRRRALRRAACPPRTSASAAARSSARIRAGRLSFAERAAPADAGRAHRLRPRREEARARLGVGALAGHLRMARGDARAREPRAATAGSLDQLVVVRSDGERIALGLRHARRARRRRRARACRCAVAAARRER